MNYRMLVDDTVWVDKHLDLPFDVPFGGCKQSGLGREQARHPGRRRVHPGPDHQRIADSLQVSANLIARQPIGIGAAGGRVPIIHPCRLTSSLIAGTLAGEHIGHQCADSRSVRRSSQAARRRMLDGPFNRAVA